MEVEDLIRLAREHAELGVTHCQELMTELANALEHADAEARKAWAEVRNQDDRATEAEADLEYLTEDYNRFVIRVGRRIGAMQEKIQPVLDAWNIPGPRPDYHEAAKYRLRGEWNTLYVAVEDLAKGDLRELFAREYTEERRIQAHLRGGDPT